MNIINTPYELLGNEPTYNELYNFLNNPEYEKLFINKDTYVRIFDSSLYHLNDEIFLIGQNPKLNIHEKLTYNVISNLLKSLEDHNPKNKEELKQHEDNILSFNFMIDILKLYYLIKLDERLKNNFKYENGKRRKLNN